MRWLFARADMGPDLRPVLNPMQDGQKPEITHTPLSLELDFRE
jgi:hypothetical protein